MPSTPSSSAVLTKAEAIWRRRPPTAFIVPISAVCSATSVDIVFAISTNAERTASSVIT